MKKIIDIINQAIKGEGVECLPCERVNLDKQRFSEYIDSEEHKAGDIFESDQPNSKVLNIPRIDDKISSILRFFLDGSRRTYKIADLLVKGRYLPIIAGQVGVAVTRRCDDTNKLIPLREFCSHKKVIAFPDQLTTPEDIENLKHKIEDQIPVCIKLLRYTVKKDRDPVDLGIAKIMSYMVDLELNAVHELSDKHLLRSNSILVKDGPLRYKNVRGRGFDITQFRNVIGISKTFRPSFTVGSGRAKKDVGVLAASLDFGKRTPVFKTSEEDKSIGMWYLRIRPKKDMIYPLQGVVKIECYAVNNEEEENGLDSQRVNTLSAHVLRERNVTPYGSDVRWATHIYPIYQTETFIKANMLSDIRFKLMF